MTSRRRDRLRMTAAALLGRASEATRAAAGALARQERNLLSGGSIEEVQRVRVGAAMAEHDMSEDADEAYYRDRYLEWIDEAVDLRGPLRILDAGCGSGRLTVPVAERVAANGGTVVGVDFIGPSIEAARRRAADARLSNVELFEADLLDWLSSQPDAGFSHALFLEVGFVMPRLEEALTELFRVMRPGATLLASLRPAWFLALLGAQQRRWQVTDEVVSSRSGLLDGIGFQNWHAAEDLRALFERAGFGDVELRGLGSLSGIEGDPLSTIVRPSELDGEGREALARAERAFGESNPDVGRYVMIRARR